MSSNPRWYDQPKQRPRRRLDSFIFGGLLAAAAGVGAFTLLGGGDDVDPEMAVQVDAGEADGTGTETTDGATASDGTADGTDDETSGTSDEGQPAATGAEALLPLTYAEAEESGRLDEFDFGPNCDPETQRIAIPTVYAAPCLVDAKGVEAANEHPGVDADTIRIVVYEPSPADFGALVQAALDPADVQLATLQGYVDLFSEYYETWGREIELIPFQASGIDEISARADAQTVAQELNAFASFNGPSQQPAYADELAALGVLCINCGLGVPDSTFQDAAPYMWGSLQTPEQFLVNLADFVSERVMDRPAAFAGDPAYQTRERSFGVVHFEQDPPVYTAVREGVEELGRERGWEAEMYLTYLFDIGSFETRAQQIVAQLKEKEVTTVIFLGDMLMPSYLTRAATAQNYYPEWIITGTVLTDTTTMGRGYDQVQWRNAFGISSIGVPVGIENQEAWTLYEWYTGRDPEATQNVRIIFEFALQLMTGFHMAGPELTPETFEAGLFNYPVSGGTPTAPQISYGNQVFTDPDYQGYDDVVEIWWDPDAVGLDERGQQGTGMMQYANFGRRYVPGQMTTDELGVFDRDTSIVGFDGIPADELSKQYPSPAGG
jgi:hypothetical protein